MRRGGCKKIPKFGKEKRKSKNLIATEDLIEEQETQTFDIASYSRHSAVCVTLREIFLSWFTAFPALRKIIPKDVISIINDYFDLTDVETHRNGCYYCLRGWYTESPVCESIANTPEFPLCISCKSHDKLDISDFAIVGNNESWLTLYLNLQTDTFGVSEFIWNKNPLSFATYLKNDLGPIKALKHLKPLTNTQKCIRRVSELVIQNSTGKLSRLDDNDPNWGRNAYLLHQIANWLVGVISECDLRRTFGTHKLVEIAQPLKDQRAAVRFDHLKGFFPPDVTSEKSYRKWRGPAVKGSNVLMRNSNYHK